MIDTKKIATLARAGLTDEQIEQVCKIFAGATGAPTVEATPTVEVAPATLATEAEQHPSKTRAKTLHRRNARARALALAIVARGPCMIKDIAQQVYGDDSLRSFACADKMVRRLALDGLVSVAGECATLAGGQGAASPRVTAKPMQAELAIEAPVTNGALPDVHYRRAAAIASLCEAIRSDVVRAGGKVTSTLSILTAPHRRLLDAACVGLGRTSNLPLAQTIAHRRGSDGSSVIGGLKFTKSRHICVRRSGMVFEWEVCAV